MLARALMALLLALASAAHAQQPIPRTPEGKPDFSGAWVIAFAPQVMERVQGATTLVVTEDEANKLVAALQEKRRANRVAVYDPDDDTIILNSLPRVGGEWRTSVVIDPADGKLPLTAEWRARAQEVTQGMQRHGRGLTVTEDPEVLPHNERCLGGPGRAPLGAAPIPVLRQVVQTPGHLMIYTETLFGETRIVGIDARPRPSAMASFFGDSVARWEGDELVVETTATSDDKPARPTGLVVRDSARVIERFRLTSPDAILYRFTIEDPGVYTSPWHGEFEMQRTHERIFEAACHEANYGLANILSGAREMERRAAAKPKP